MSSLIENLLYQCEGTALDFKKEQYPFENATDEKKSELLKDILAFANSWRQDYAYILIGVEEVKVGRHIPVGTDNHPDDSRFQQFINGKTNRKVKFNYEVHLVEGKKIGLFRIAKQERPIYAVKNYGKVKKDLVYYRSGSSTEIANPDDIARMGRDFAKESMGRDFAKESICPVIDLQFADIQNRKKLGTNIKFHSITYQKPKIPLQDYIIPRNRDLIRLSTSKYKIHRKSDPYWRYAEQYIRLTKFLSPILFVAQNCSSSIAKNLKIEIINNSHSAIKLYKKLPHKPCKYNIQNSTSSIRPAWQNQSVIDISYHNQGWALTINFGDIQPKSTIWLDEFIFIGSTRQDKFEFNACVYADNLPEPQVTVITTEFTVENRPSLTIEDLQNMPPFDS